MDARDHEKSTVGNICELKEPLRIASGLLAEFRILWCRVSEVDISPSFRIVYLSVDSGWAVVTNTFDCIAIQMSYSLVCIGGGRAQ